MKRIVLFFGIVFILLTSCEKNSVSYVYQGYVTGLINQEHNFCAVYVNNVPSMPSLYINNIEFPLSFDYYEFEYTSYQFMDIVTPETELRIEFIKSNGSIGSIYSTVITPGSLSYITDNSIDTMSVDNDYTIYWNKPIGGDFYNIDFRLNYYYSIDSLDSQQAFTWIDTSVVDTFITIPTEMVFWQDTYYSIWSSEGYIKVTPVAGAEQENGPGNFEGDGIGYFSVAGWPSERQLLAEEF